MEDLNDTNIFQDDDSDFQPKDDVDCSATSTFYFQDSPVERCESSLVLVGHPSRGHYLEVPQQSIGEVVHPTKKNIHKTSKRKGILS